MLVMFSLVPLFAAKKTIVTQLPDPLRPLAEVETNVVFSVGSPSENKWMFTVDLEPSVSNCIEFICESIN